MERAAPLSAPARRDSKLQTNVARILQRLHACITHGTRALGCANSWPSASLLARTLLRSVRAARWLRLKMGLSAFSVSCLIRHAALALAGDATRCNGPRRRARAADA